MLSAQRLNKEVDSEIFKIQRMKSTEPPPRELRVSKRRDPIDEISDIDKSDVETDTNGEEDNKKEINLMKKFDDMIKEMKTSVGEIKKGKKKRGSLFEPDKSSKCSKKTDQSNCMKSSRTIKEIITTQSTDQDKISSIISNQPS